MLERPRIALFVGAVLTAYSIAEPALAETECHLRIGDALGHLATGTVIRFVSKDQAELNIRQTERLLGGSIDPDYVSAKTTRVRVQPDQGAEIGAVVPRSMNVEVGERVQYTTSHRNTELPCTYFPNIITKPLPG